MINLKRIIEQQGSEQLYDLGRDFSNFRRTMDGTSEQIKNKFEQAIGAKLNGKRIRARASRGYKQYVKDYEFDVTNVSIDDYYDNFVIVAKDNATPKPKEYFLKPGFKIQILGPATGQPSPQKGGKPQETSTASPIQPKENPNAAQHEPMAQAPAGQTPSETSAVKEGDNDHYDAYSLDDIGKDSKPWLLPLLLKPETIIRDFTKKIGWMKDVGDGKSIAMYDIVIPINALNTKLTPEILRDLLRRSGTINTNYELVKMEPNETDDEWNIRIKKSKTNI